MRALDRGWFAGLLLVAAVFAAYQPVWHAGFIWDDGELVTQNPCIVGPFGLKEIWTTRAADICPLTLTTFWVEHALWGLRPLGYHLVTVAFHAAGAIVLWRVLRNLQIPGAWLGAAIWALHPVESESVAWIAETKNTQSGLFYLLSILFFVKGLEARTGKGIRDYILTLLFAALAMASKSSTVILPIVLILCAWWKEGRWHWRHLAKIGPIFCMSFAASGATLWTQKLQGANDALWTRSWPERVATAGDAAGFYLGKLLWPHPLITIYPHWEINAASPMAYLSLLLVLAALLIFWLKRDSGGRPYFFAFAYFLTALLPVLDFANNSFFRYSFVADHFQYLASMGPLALAGAGVVRVSDRFFSGRSFLIGAGLVLLLGFLTWRRTWVYESQETLWTDTVAGNPACSMAYDNLGWLLAKKGRTDEAMELYDKALKIDPRSFGSHYNLANLLFQMGRIDEAISEYEKTLEIRPRFAEAHSNLGVAFLQKGEIDKAIGQYREALKMDPDSYEAHFNLGNILAQNDQAEGAIAEYREALKINPNSFGAHFNLGNVLLQSGQANEAIVQYQETLRLKPDFMAAQANLAKARALGK